MSKFLFKIESARLRTSTGRRSSAVALLSTLAVSFSSEAAQVSPYYRTSKLETPSYSVKVGGKYYLRSNRDNLKTLLLVDNGIVTSALIEKWYSKYRVSVRYELKNGRYQIAKAIVTNKGSFLSVSSPILNDNKCSITDDDVTKIATVVASTDYVSSFVDSSCSNLSPVKKISLSKLKQNLNPSSDEGKKLLLCLNKLSSEAKSETARERIVDLWASVVALMKRQIETGEPGLKVSCEDVEKIGSASRCEANKGSLIFPIQDGNIAVDTDQLQQKFIHELIHRSRPLVASNEEEEKFTAFVVSSCSGDFSARKFVELDEAPKKTGEDLKKLPLPVKEAVANTPPQKIETTTVQSLEQLSSSKTSTGTSTGSNANALAAAYDDAVAQPVKTFSATTDAVAQAFIPSANAAIDTYSGTSLSSTANESSSGVSSSRRSPASASESSYRPFEVTKTSGFGKIPESKEKIVEEILVNRGDGATLSSKTTVAMAEAPNLTIGKELKIPEAKVENLSELARSNSAGGSSGISLDVSSGSGQNAASPTSSNRRSIASTGSSTASVGGIIVVGNNVTGSNYQRFKKQIVEDGSFRASLEQAGILITRGGVLLSRPRQVNATYIDNGSSLVFAN